MIAPYWLKPVGRIDGTTKMPEQIFLAIYLFACAVGLFLAFPMAKALIRKCVSPKQHSKIPQPPSRPLPKSPDQGGNGHDMRVLH